MCNPSRAFSPLLWAIILLARIEASPENSQVEEVESVCDTSDLNHSRLIECKLTQCANEPENLKIKHEDEIGSKVLHMVSSRSGDRFNSTLLESLNFIQTDYEKQMDINTTLYVDTQERHGEIYGFGTTIDLGSAAGSLDDDKLHAIAEMLYSQTNRGLRLSLLRYRVNSESLSQGRMMKTLYKIDSILSSILGGDARVKLVLSFDYWPSSNAMGNIQALESISFDELKTLECWAVAMPHVAKEGFVDEGLREFIQDRCLRTSNLFNLVPMKGAAQYVEKLSPEIKGLLVQSDFESTYSNIDQVLVLKRELDIITIGSPKALIGDYGNWQTAQHTAIEIMNHLKHNSKGFIDFESTIGVFSEEQRDASIYNLGQEHESYFKGPIYYAIGHFSKYVTPGSQRLSTTISTQPNMFAADYIAFLAPQKHCVAIIINDNEHDLPFRLAIDGRIRVHVMLKSKSFNTLVIKL